MKPLFTNRKLLVFTKAPIQGEVKTRLAKAIGYKRAAILAARLIRHTVQKVCAAAVSNIELWCTPSIRHPSFARLRSLKGLTLKTQCGDNLGSRMYFAARRSLRHYRYVIIIGTDCPGIDKQYLVDAFEALERQNDLVIGPASDGGYVLIGFRKIDVRLFQGIPWGSARVLRLTLARCKRLDYRVAILESRSDIDTLHDLKKARPLVEGLNL